ncbi:pirin family protein, partial [Pseudomonas aeruginosa]|nr:pirin family protein [Pseudomonas aeruginosa]
MKRVTGTYSAPRPHWVGDGFPARSMFSYNTHGQHLSPFLLLDYAGPYTFAPSDTPRGVGQHPHRGFETVTYMLDGRMRHRDNHGNEGLLTPGSVQWMTAGRGLVHSEMPEQESGQMRGFQLWVNLPAKEKMTEPKYQ